MSKIAVILFNLGGPSNLNQVEHFLFNLFYDKNIITLPNPFRWILARIISASRADKSKELYKYMGGSSPIYKYTKEQAKELEIKLRKLDPHNQYEVMISMRYSYPFSSDLIGPLKSYRPDEIILLPLYPQYSTTTTKSSLEDFIPRAKNITKNIKSVCCYPTDDHFIKSHQERIRETYHKHQLEGKDVVILFSAHSIPQKCVNNGDPYQWQIEASVASIMKDLDLPLEHKICYQSKVGRLKWLEPSIDSEITNLAAMGKGVVLVPIAFVSEHLETLVELDRDYKLKADQLGIKDYYRVPSLAIEDNFIASLANTTINLVNNVARTRICPEEFCKCGFNNNGVN